MTRQYPYICSVSKARRGRCFVCKQIRPDKVARVQTSWFRGDDELVPFHEACLSGAWKEAVINYVREKLRNE